MCSSSLKMSKKAKKSWSKYSFASSRTWRRCFTSSKIFTLHSRPFPVSFDLCSTLTLRSPEIEHLDTNKSSSWIRDGIVFISEQRLMKWNISEKISSWSFRFWSDTTPSTIFRKRFLPCSLKRLAKRLKVWIMVFLTLRRICWQRLTFLIISIENSQQLYHGEALFMQDVRSNINSSFMFSVQLCWAICCKKLIIGRCSKLQYTGSLSRGTFPLLAALSMKKTSSSWWLWNVVGNIFTQDARKGHQSFTKGSKDWGREHKHSKVVSAFSAKE